MIFEVRLGDFAAQKIAASYTPERTARGGASEWDFWSGPLAAALVGFRAFEQLRFDDHEQIRSLHIVDPVFGAVVFVGVLVEPGLVEIADFDVDPDYWDLIADDPPD